MTQKMERGGREKIGEFSRKNDKKNNKEYNIEKLVFHPRNGKDDSVY